MFVDPNPFPYLRQDQFVGFGLGEIYFTDDSIPEDKKEWLRAEYKKWWDKEQEENIKNDRT